LVLRSFLERGERQERGLINNSYLFEPSFLFTDRRLLWGQYVRSKMHQEMIQVEDLKSK
jgi:hypothetical protein